MKNISFIFLMLFTAPLMGVGQNKLFQLLPPAQCGVSFVNNVPDSSYMLTNNYMYSINGGGVAVGDFNNDGLQDFVLTSNYGGISLYINKGGMKFEEAKETGLISSDWCTGICAGDANGDGLLDLYVCRSEFMMRSPSNNHLFINQGGLKFIDRAFQFGVEGKENSTGATFFDMDKDGDLDLYVVNGPNTDINRLTYVLNESDKHWGSDRLYENKGDGTYVDVSQERGIRTENGFGLSVVAADINQDGWLDLYVANDFIYEDFIYMNDGTGKFLYRTPQMLKHTSFFSMGSDVVDFNNDLLPDIISVDMLQEDLRYFKWESVVNAYDYYEKMAAHGRHNQSIRNALQLNMGDGTFAEIGELAGIPATDWSWTPLMADYNNDGWKDLFISNGIKFKSNMDYIEYEMDSIYVTRRNAVKHQTFVLEPGMRMAPPSINKYDMSWYPQQVLANYVFENNKDLTFKNRTIDWGIDKVVNSNGAAYADFDGDGDLDLIVNNYNDVASVYKNTSREQRGGHFLRVKASCADNGNRDALGTKVYLYAGGQSQYYEITRTRGFQSSSEAAAHFGLGANLNIDSVVVVWLYNNARQVVVKPQANTVLEVKMEQATGKHAYQTVFPPEYFNDVTDAEKITFKHQEDNYDDFKIEPLLSHMYSQLGPGLAVGDVNGDGADDFFIGGATGQAGVLYLQQKDGTFAPAAAQPWEADKAFEDMGAVFFDFDGDGDLDLYVVSGGNEYAVEGERAGHRVYLNKSKGKFTKDDDALAQVINFNGGCVAAADFDGDGDLDLFVGGKVKPGQYPRPPQSCLLRNDKGKLTDVTAQVAPELKNIGMVNAAIWSDYDDDGRPDLVLAGQWMPVTFFRNTGAGFKNTTEGTGTADKIGWWYSLTGADVDADGDTDYIVGNLGLNTRYHASPEAPVMVYADDYDKSGTNDAITTVHANGLQQPIHRYTRITDQMTFLRKKFLRIKPYAFGSIDAVLSKEQLSKALVLKATYFPSAVLRNLGGGKFSLETLPTYAQFAPVFGILAEDFDGDGALDLLLSGNLSSFEIETGRVDALRGVFLKGKGDGKFEYITQRQSGFTAPGDGRALALAGNNKGKAWVLSAENNDRLKAFQPLKLPTSGMEYALPGEQSAHVYFKNGKKRKVEFYRGGAGLAQSAAGVLRTPAMDKVIFFKGNEPREVRF